MGTSGGGGGGGGSGGGGGGGGGSGGSGSSSGSGGSGGGRSGSTGGRGVGGKSGGGRGGAGSPSGGRGSSKNAVRPLGEQQIVQVLSRLKPNYIAAQFAGPMSTGIAHDLSILAVDVEENKSWNSLCARFGLKQGSKPADIRDAILGKYEKHETDSRIKDTATATTLQFFEALCKYDDDVLYRPGKDSTFSDFDSALVKDPLPTFLRLHYENILQREEPKLPASAVQKTITKVANQLGTNLAKKLTARYSQGGKVPRANYLQKPNRDPKESLWLIKAVRG
jgi:hypothetical protein